MKCLWLILFSLTANAQEGFMGYGGDAKVKVFSLGLREDIIDGSYLQLKAGYFGDAYAAIGGGMKIELNPLVARAGLNLAAESGGTLLNLNGEVYLGLKDSSGRGIGVQYENLGSHNFLSVQLSSEW